MESQVSAANLAQTPADRQAVRHADRTADSQRHLCFEGGAGGLNLGSTQLNRREEEILTLCASKCENRAELQQQHNTDSGNSKNTVSSRAEGLF